MQIDRYPYSRFSSRQSMLDLSFMIPHRKAVVSNNIRKVIGSVNLACNRLHSFDRLKLL